MAVIEGAFLDREWLSESYDLIVACYTLEHIAEQVRLWQTIQQCLRPGGLLYLALPSTRGPVYHWDKSAWVATHPRDHFVDYDPTSLRRTLALYGLQLQQIWPASYHQRRCRGLRRWLPPALYRRYADWQAWGDTMEALAVKPV